MNLWQHPSFRLSLRYAATAGLWVLLSGPALRLLARDAAWLSAFEAYDDWLFLILSAALVGWLAWWELKSDIKAVTAGLSPGADPGTAALSVAEREEDPPLRHQARVLEAVDSAILAVDDRGRITCWNGAAARLFGWSAAVVLGEPLLDVVAADRSAGEPVLNRLLSGERWAGEMALKGRESSPFIGRITGAPLWGSRGELLGAVLAVEDVTARIRAEEALRQQESLFREIAGSASDLLLVFDADGSLVFAGPSSRKVLGFTPAELAEGTFELLLAMVHADDREGFRRALHEARTYRRPSAVRMRIGDRSGEYRWMETTVRPLTGEGRPLRYLVAGRDVTAWMTCEERLVHQALHDPVTGLPNRACFIRRLEEAAAAAAAAARRYAVLVIDLDNFKLVNDSLGHRRGDDLLAAVGERLKAGLGIGDILARLGGDEFAVLVREVAEESEATAIAERILAHLQEPFCLGGREIFLTASVGVVVSTPEHRQTDDLLRDADVAMYRAKQKGKNQYELFSPAMKEKMVARLQMETDLRRALEREELVVYYQPVVLVASGRIAGLEALVRWHHPQRGIVSPAEFIPLAEEVGLILPIGRWVLRQACRQVKRWQEEYPHCRDLVLSVNLSARQLQDPRLVDDVRAALVESGLAPQHLTLEITESVLVQDLAATTQALRQLKGLGVRLAIDDFGTGYSSLAYLKRFAVDALKVDRSFVERLGQDAEDSAIVAAVISLAKTLKLKVTGEGIETAEQLAELRALGCDEGQGYYFTRPLPVEQTQALLAGQPGW